MKSLEYIKQTIASGRTGLTNVDWEDLSETSFKDAFKQMYQHDFPECNRIETRTSKDGGDLIAEFIYDPDVDYNYFSMERSTHDGTFLFIGETITKLLHKVFMCGTYNKEVMDGIPSPMEDENFFKMHHLKYTVGDIVLGTEFDGDFVPEDKKWMRERTTAMLPIKFEVVSNKI